MTEAMQLTEFKGGMTVKELKEAIKDWPETFENGEPCEVWMSTGRQLSSPVTSICPLNMDREQSADVIFGCNVYD